ncbi:MAG TPA: hypothetical protein VF646_05680 [Cytophagales bacterium]|jgi:hypothetical protein
MVLLLLLAGALSSCASSGHRAERISKEQKKMERLMAHNRALLENIRYHEARLDTLMKMEQGQLKALYRVR